VAYWACVERRVYRSTRDENAFGRQRDWYRTPPAGKRDVLSSRQPEKSVQHLAELALKRRLGLLDGLRKAMFGSRRDFEAGQSEEVVVGYPTPRGSTDR
jgi:hypothetical protein